MALPLVTTRFLNWWRYEQSRHFSHFDHQVWSLIYNSIEGDFPTEFYARINLMKESDFIAKLLEVTSTVESPTSFIKWAGYACVATILRNNIWIPFGARRTKIFPNIYVLIIGDSGETRKSTPLKIMNYLVKQVGNTKLIEGRASIQGILKELANNKMMPNGKTLSGATGLIYTEELAAFMVKDPSANGILTDIYDYHEEHPIYLKGEDPVVLKEVVVNMIAASNSAHIADLFSKVDLYGGLVGRTMLIIESEARKRDLGLFDSSTEEQWKEVVDHLKRLTQWKGAATITPSAMEFFTDWYARHDIKGGTSKTGFEPRMHTNIMKLAMILSACRMDQEFKGVITEDEIEMALNELSTLRPNYYKIVGDINMSTNNVATLGKDIMKFMLINPDVGIEDSTLLREVVFGKADAFTFEKAIDTLARAGMITAYDGKYYLSAKSKEQFLKKFKEMGKVQ